MKNSLLCLCLAIGFCLLPLCVVHAQLTNNLPATGTTMPSWTRSVVKIKYELNGKILTGAGVIISSSGYVLTAAHVGSGIGSPDAVISVGTATDSMRYAAPQYQYTATEVNQIADSNNNVYDLKLLKITNPAHVQFTAAAFASVVPFPGDEIFVAGFPDLPFDYLPQQQSPLSVYKTAILSCFSETNTSVPTRLHYGSGAIPGFSGGPVFNSSGQLIGIHSSRTTANINNLLYPDKPCNDGPNQDKPCYGNVLRFQVMDTQNQLRTQEIAMNYEGLKSVLDNYCWGTSIWRIPQQWINLL